MATFYFSSLVIILYVAIKAAAEGESLSRPIAKHNCRENCGKMLIPYPFGIGKDCYAHESLNIKCDETFNPPKVFLTSIQMEVLSLSLNGVIAPLVKGPIISSNCSGLHSGRSVNLTGTPFVFSERNIFTAAAAADCNTRISTTKDSLTSAGCPIPCRSTKEFAWREMLPKFNVRKTGESSLMYPNCTGAASKCCQSIILNGFKIFNPDLDAGIENNQGEKQCKLAYLSLSKQVVLETLSNKVQDTSDFVPVQLEWILNAKSFKKEDYRNSDCSDFNPQTSRDFCSCNNGYEGNPYLGCTDVDECKNPKNHSCGGITKCKNTIGSYKCVVKAEWIIVFVIVGVSGVIFAWWVYKQVQKRRNIKLKKKFFKQNGGLLLQQQIISIESVQQTKIFSLNELEKATDCFNETKVLGKGGQGTVYKGMLSEGRIVAVKKSLKVDEAKIEEFVNEVVILSQINHRHVVKLIGCCLETEVPLLVYEFIPNGSIYDYLHDKSREIELSWQMRLRIATEAAGAIAYLHTAASVPVYHRDIKSTNILLDEKFRAKVSDFGISRSISVDQTHLTTNVKGTFGYLDPDYYKSGQFTEKSDVYSFGVVLVELLSGQKPVYLLETSQEAKSLAMEFNICMEQNRLFDMIDADVNSDCHKEERIAVANLAKRCLIGSGRNRPTMKEVANSLEQIRCSPSYEASQQKAEVSLLHDEAVPTSSISDFDDEDVLSLLSNESMVIDIIYQK